jgi:hypothetical protein
VHHARNFYRLYGDVFRSIDGAQARQLGRLVPGGE